MIEIAILKNFDSGTYKAGVQLAGSLTTYFDDISVAKNIPSSAMVVGNYVIVAIPGGNPRDACVIATWPQGTPGGGMEVHGNEYHDPDFASETALSSHEAAISGVHGLVIPLVSQASKTYYINAASGDDDHDGESYGNAWETWGKAESMIPRFLLHSYTIYIIGGLPEIIDLRSRTLEATLTIRGYTTTPSNHEVNGIDLSQIIGSIRVNYFRSLGRIYLRNSLASPNVISCFRYLEPRSSGDWGIEIISSIGYVRECDFGTDVVTRCIVATNSRIVSRINSGNATQYGLDAIQSSVIAKVGSQPTGTVADEYTENGGVIR